MNHCYDAENVDYDEDRGLMIMLTVMVNTWVMFCSGD